jgi:hypothetical protein
MASGAGVVEVLSSGTPGDFVPTSGRLEGPIQFSFEQEDSVNRTKLRAVGSGQSLAADFGSQEGIELKLAGQVVAHLTETRPKGEARDGQTMTNEANVSGDEATVTLDRTTRKPIRYRFTGRPAETRIKPGSIG